jgi:NDP-sugar pyrophosphorylase family protein
MPSILKKIDVFILCGGKGRRLKKVSGRIPKPMVPIGRRPFLDIVLSRLRKAGFKRFILGTGYEARYIKEYYGEHRISGANIVFSREGRPLGTGGAVKKAKRLINSDIFFVLNGDSVSEFDAQDLVEFYKRKKARIVVLLRKVKNGHDYGAITVNDRAEITRFSEKDPRARYSFINGGVYLFDKSIFPEMPRHAKFSLEYDLLPRMIGKGFYGYKGSGFFIDIGTPDRYVTARKYLLKKCFRSR